MKIQERNWSLLCTLTCGYSSKLKLASLRAVMPVSCPFICSKAWVIRSCKLPVSSWNPHTTIGCKRHGSSVEGYHDSTEYWSGQAVNDRILFPADEPICVEGHRDDKNCTRAVFASFFFFFFFFCKLVFRGRRILAQWLAIHKTMHTVCAKWHKCVTIHSHQIQYNYEIIWLCMEAEVSHLNKEDKVF